MLADSVLFLSALYTLVLRLANWGNETHTTALAANNDKHKLYGDEYVMSVVAQFKEVEMTTAPGGLLELTTIERDGVPVKPSLRRRVQCVISGPYRPVTGMLNT